MFTTSTYLTTRRPSSTTIEFVVSNAPLLSTVNAYCIFYLAVLLRISVGLFASAIVLIKARYRLDTSEAILSKALYSRVTSVDLPIVEAVAVNTSWRVLIPVTLVILYLCFHRFHTGK